MTTVFVVMEKSPLWGVRVSKVFENKWDADEYEYDAESMSFQLGDGTEYWIEEWEVA